MRRAHLWTIGAMVAAALAASPAGAIGTIVTTDATIETGDPSGTGDVTIDAAAGAATPPDLPALTSPGAAPQMSAAAPSAPSYGNGALGALSTSNAVVLTAGTHQYASIQLLPGGSITCTGAVTILCTGDFESYGPITGDAAITIRCGGDFFLHSASPTNLLTTTSGSIEVTSGGGLALGSGVVGEDALLQTDTGNVLLQSLGVGVASQGFGTFGCDVRAIAGSVTIAGVTDTMISIDDVIQSGGGPLVIRGYGANLAMRGTLQVQSGSPVTLESATRLDMYGSFQVIGSSSVTMLAVAGPLNVTGSITTLNGDIVGRSGGGIQMDGSFTHQCLVNGTGDVRFASTGGAIGVDRYTLDTNNGDIELLADDDIRLGYASNVRTDFGGISMHGGDDVTVGDEARVQTGGAGPLTVRGGDYVNIGEARQDAAKGEPRSASGGGDTQFQGAFVDVSSGGGCRIDAFNARSRQGDFSVIAGDGIEVAKKITARRDISLVARRGGIDVSLATLQTDEESERDSGTIRVDSYDADATIDATSATIQTGDTDIAASGDIFLRIFAFVPPPVPVQSYVLPKKVRVEVVEGSPERTRLAASGFFDTGPNPLDLGSAAVITVGTKQFSVEGFTQKNRGYYHTEEGLAVRLVPAKSGSSRTKFRLNTKGASLAGAFPRDGDVKLAFNFGVVEGSGEVGLQGGMYVFGRKAGFLSEPNVFLVRAAARLAGEGADSLQLIAGLATDGRVPAVAPDLTVDFGDGYTATIPSTAFKKRGARFVSTGNPRAILDYAREQVLFVATGATLGTFPDGAQPVTIRVGLGSETREVSVRMVKSGTTLKY